PAPNLIASASRIWSWFKDMLGRAERMESKSGPREQGSQRNGSHKSFVDWCSWWLQVPDAKLGWLPFGFLAGKRAIRKHRCMAIYSSAPVWTAHLIGLLLKRFTGLPWVADFRDPWRVNPFRGFPYKSVDIVDDWLARQVIYSADWVISNTEPMRRTLVGRFPHLESKFKTIPNGFDPQDFVDLKACRPEV